MTQKRKGILGAAAVMFGALALAGSAPVGSNPIKDATRISVNAPKPVEARKSFGGDNPHRYYRKMFYNQRQYRKLLRQNPSLRRSKKLRAGY